MITGQQGGLKDKGTGPYGTYDAGLETPGAFRGGALYGGIIYRGYAYFGGVNSEKVLHGVQNTIHRSKLFQTPYFENINLPSKPWSYFGNYRASSLIY